tara:strand:+ start:143 stop:619 length:477 start_codon:yes stop_codon:yes gene_type:complete
MNQVFASGLAIVIALILWSSKKKSKGTAFFRSQEDSFSKAQAQSSLVIDKNLGNQISKKVNDKKCTNFLKQISLNSIETKKKLTKLMSSNPSDRFLAIEIASKWGNKKAVPFLRRGLRDSDSRVVIASAAAISSYKGKTFDLKKHQSSRPPRNVSLMR